MAETILQHWLFSRFAFPFLIVFFIAFAILEKTKVLGSDKKQLNALVAFILGLIFVGVAYPVDVVQNMILFLTVALVVMFVALILWGFVAGEAKIESPKAKIFFGVLIFIGIVIAVLWATGFYDNFVDWLFRQDWSGTFWTNFLFIVMVAVALAVVLRSGGGKA